MKATQYEQLVETARLRAQASIDSAKACFGLGSYRRYDIDLPTAKISFFDEDGVEKISADIQVAGSWSPLSDSWLWAWDNESLPEVVAAQMGEVRQFGEQNDIGTVRTSFEPCDEGKAWSMASIAAQILDAECIYRVVSQKSYLFLLLFSIRKTE
ncbi:hypothetical protein Nit79A3_1023 [Nitrosomonas sp. Is79A3]|uniref:DUF6882 domain-containing protein n=1 Tax=Nitrosomonas sp. (strain Is79A3) TaxID=261292 RepID=UPI000215C750